MSNEYMCEPGLRRVCKRHEVGLNQTRRSNEYHAIFSVVHGPNNCPSVQNDGGHFVRQRSIAEERTCRNPRYIEWADQSRFVCIG